MPAGRRLFIGTAFVLFTITACSKSSVTPWLHHRDTKTLNNPNVLLITLDTTRADHIGAYGYRSAQTPNLDALAADGALFENCITPTAYTLPSHSSIMTGLYPPAHGVRLNGEAALPQSNMTLAERLTARGYKTGAFVGAFVLDGRWGLSQGFQHYDDHFHLGQDQRLDLARVQRPASEVTDAAIKWLDEPRTSPFFAWVHFYDAHGPYEPPEPFRSRFAAGGKNALYDGEIAFADSQVGRLMNWLESRGLSDNTIVVVVGDHGEGLGDHGEEEHGYYIYDYAVRVPLIVRIPGTSGVRVASQVRTIDVAPTILAASGVSADPKSIQGESVVALFASEKNAPRYAYSESMATRLQYGWAALYAMRSDTHKYIEAPRSELYALRADPAEKSNQLENERRAAVQLRDELRKVREESDRRAPKAEEANIDQETMRKLASLGYLGGAASRPTGDDKNLADPKDKMHLFDSIGYAAHLISKNDYKEAANVLEIVLKDDPDIPQAQLLLVSSYRKTGRTEQAKQILDGYLKRDPSNTRALVAMAEILLDQGHHDDVLAICRRAIAEDAQNARAYEVMADVYMSTNSHAEALPFLRKVVEIQPKLTRSRNNLAAALIATGQGAEAERLLQEIQREYPKFPLANFHLGLLREQQGRLPEARDAYDREVKNHPQSVVARFNLGNVLLRLGDDQGAEREMRLLIKENPAEARPYLLLGRVLLGRGGRLREVESLAQQGLERAKEPDLKALGYFILADVYSREGRRAEVERAVKKAEHFRAQIGG